MHIQRMEIFIFYNVTSGVGVVSFVAVYMFVSLNHSQLPLIWIQKCILF